MHQLPRIKVLVVDPAGYSRRLLQELLNSLGVQDIVSAPRSENALSALRANYSNVVFCDEACDTAGFIKALRRDTKTQNITVPVFMISAGVQQEQIAVARDAGINGVIVKPISAATVERKLRVALGNPKDWVASKEFIGPDRRTNQERRLSCDLLGFSDRRGGSSLRADIFAISPMLKPGI
jgi:CheY-like chemotaxis protein